MLQPPAAADMRSTAPSLGPVGSVQKVTWSRGQRKDGFGPRQFLWLNAQWGSVSAAKENEPSRLFESAAGCGPVPVHVEAGESGGGRWHAADNRAYRKR